MPVTPLHVLAAVPLKLAGRRFSLTVFAFTQVLIDLETLTWMALGAWPIHRFLHTWPGALVAGLAGWWFGRPICARALRWWNRHLDARQARWLAADAGISQPVAAVSAFVGSASHVLLDSVMHADMRPLAPFSDANALLYVIFIDALHLLCVALGVVGAVALLCARLWRVGRRGTGRDSV